MIEKIMLIMAMKTAVSVTGMINWISGTATRARPKPVNPLITEATKIISDRAMILPAVTILLLV